MNNLVLGVSMRGFSLTTPLRDFNPGSPLCGALSLGPPLFVGPQSGSSVEVLGCRVLSGGLILRGPLGCFLDGRFQC